MDGLDIKAVREAAATAIRTVVPSKWTVYAAPTPSLALPALVVRPGTDYIQRATARTWDVNLALDVIQPVAAGQVALDVLDDVLADLIPELLDITTLRFGNVQSVGSMQTEGGAPVIVATIPISL